MTTSNKVYFVDSTVLFYSEEKGGRAFMPDRNGYSPYIRNEVFGDIPVRFHGMPPSTQSNHNEEYHTKMILLFYDAKKHGNIKNNMTFHLIEGRKIVGEGCIKSDIKHDYI